MPMYLTRFNRPEEIDDVICNTRATRYFYRNPRKFTSGILLFYARSRPEFQFLQNAFELNPQKTQLLCKMAENEARTALSARLDENVARTALSARLGSSRVYMRQSAPPSPSGRFSSPAPSSSLSLDSGSYAGRAVRLPSISMKDTQLSRDVESLNLPDKPPTSSEHACCKKLYLQTCRQLRIAPLSRFLRQVGNRSISLNGEGSGRKGVKALCSGLMVLNDVSRVDLSDNGVDEFAVAYITQLLSTNVFITELVLANNNINGSLACHVGAMLMKCRTLRRIDLSGNKMSDDDAMHIADIIRNCLEVVELRLNHNELREKGGVWIGEALGDNDTIEVLDLSWNHLRGRGAECVALGLKHNCTLTDLDVSWNGFGYQGSAALGAALRTNETLTKLDVSHNRIHSPALMQLLPGLAENKGLLSLNLGPNPITADSSSAILAIVLLNKNSQLMDLDLSNVVVTKEFDVLLEELQELRPDFVCMYEKALPLHRRQWEMRRRTIFEMKNKIFNVDPLRILWHTKKNLRTIDLFNKIDKDKSYRLSRGEIRDLLERENFFISSSALDEIMDYFDVNGDGEIDLSEFVSGERRFKRATLETQQATLKKSRLTIESKMDDVPLDAGGAGGRFSETYHAAENSNSTISALNGVRSKAASSPQVVLPAIATNQNDGATSRGSLRSSNDPVVLPAITTNR